MVSRHVGAETNQFGRIASTDDNSSFSDWTCETRNLAGWYSLTFGSIEPASCETTDLQHPHFSRSRWCAVCSDTDARFEARDQVPETQFFILTLGHMSLSPLNYRSTATLDPSV